MSKKKPNSNFINLSSAMANMYEYGWDEPEETKCDKKALQREKWANYEYSDEE